MTATPPDLSKHKDVVLTQVQANALLAHWLGTATVCHSVVPLESGICSAVFRLDFDQPPYTIVVKLWRDAEDNPLPRERLRLDYLHRHTSVPCPQRHRNSSGITEQEGSPA